MKDGTVVVFPTDTVYGLGIKIGDLSLFKEKIKKVYEIKKRDINKKIVLMLSDIKYINKFVDSTNLDDNIKKIIKEYFPGAVTIIFRTNDSIKSKIGYETIGIRVPNSKKIRKFIENEGGFMFVTSANISGEKSPSKLSEIDKNLLDKVDMIIKDDKMCSGVASTIIDYSKNIIVVLRQGDIHIRKE